MKKRLRDAWDTLYAARDLIRKLMGSLVLLILAVWFVGIALQNYSVWSAQLAHVDVGLLILSLAVSLLGFLFETWIWQLLIAEFHARLGFRDVFQVFYLSNLARYIPGRIWQTSTAMVLLKTYGVPLKTSAVLSIVSQIATLTAGFLVSLPLVVLWQTKAGFSWSLVVGMVVVAVLLGLIVFFPDVWGRWLNLGLARLGRETSVFVMTRWQFMKFVALYVSSWLAAGLAFFVLLVAFYPIEPQTLPFIIAASAFGYVVGYLLLFVPGGLGVREVVLIFVLGLLMPNSMASLVAIVSRFWLVAIELFLGAIALALFTWGRRTSSPSA